MSSHEYGLTRPRTLRLEGLDLTLNPAVALLTLCTVWPLIIWLGTEPEESTGEIWWWKRRIEMAWIWLYYAVRNVWVVFLAWLYFSRFGKYVLGQSQEDTKKEYSDVSWASMMFATGMGIGLFFFGVSEPVFHFVQSMQHDARRQSFFSVDMSSQEGILLTFFNFGVHGWAPFVLIAIAVAWAHYRHGHPLTLRSAFYPLLGEKINGYVGDAIDLIAALAAFCGVAMAFGLVAVMVCSGMNWMTWYNWWLGVEDESNLQNWNVMSAVVLITGIVGTASVVIGISNGLRTFVGFAMIFSAWVMFAVFFMDDSWYQFNVLTQSIGYYLFYLVKLSHHVDAFTKSDSGVDTNGHTTLSPWFDGWQGDGAMQNWRNLNAKTNPKGHTDSIWDDHGMTGIYWGWWIALAPVAGIFMAKISKGRTIRSVINWGIGFPVLICFAWISVFGGLGIKMERRAIIDACRCGCETINAGIPFDRKFCASVGANRNGQTALSLYYEGIHRGEEKPIQYGGELTCLDVRPPVRGELGGCPSIVQLSKLRPERRWFALLDEYMTGNWFNGAKNMGRFLGGVTICALISWLIAMMDAGSWVIDNLLSNGEDKPHRIWRVCMLWTAIAFTCLLVRAGAKQPMYDSAVALQIVSFISGMLLTVFLTALPVTIYRALDDEEDDALHPAVIALGHPGNDKTNLPAFTTCGDVERTRGHPITYVDIWTTEEIQEPVFDRKRIINRWTQSVDGGILHFFDLLLGSSSKDLPALLPEVAHIASCIVAPFVMLAKGYDKINQVRHMESATTFIFGLPIKIAILVSSFITFWAWIALLIVESAPYWYNVSDKESRWVNGDEGMWALAWICYVFFAFIVACCRYNVRQILKIKGNLVQDFFCSLFFYPFVIAQIDSQRLPRVAPTPAKIDVVHVVPKAQNVAMPPMMGMGMHGTAQMPMMGMMTGTAQMPMF